jgi:hypothetical protein
VSSDESREDPMLHLLKTLPVSDIDRASADRIRLHCHRALGRRRLSTPHRAVDFAVAGALCAAYLVEVLLRALALLG